jgi:CRP-like cAMP-binding protein
MTIPTVERWFQTILAAMSGDTIERFVSESKLLAMLDPRGRDRLMAAAVKTTFVKGETIMNEGETGDSFFVVVAGSVRVNADHYGESKLLATLGAGAVFGEIAALTGEPRTATVQAETDVTALRFDRSAVVGVLEEYPKVLGMLNRIGLMRSEDTLEKMFDG